MKKSFNTPIIIGALCARENEIPPALRRAFAKLKPRFAFLPFRVEKRHLKNTIECMKLMDIEALVICGKLRRDIVPFVKKQDTSARKSGMIDVIIKKKGAFTGTNLSYRLLSNDNPRSPAGGRTGVGIFCHTCVDILTSGKKHN